jgi:lysozyme
MKKKNKLSVLEKILNTFFRWRTVYVFFIIILISLYPVFVSSGEKWRYVDEFGIKLPMRYEIHGIDVSHHNESIDWQKVKNSTDDNIKIDFCFIKATEGTDLKDSDFQKNWQGAKKVGLTAGAYHFFVPSSDPTLQAKNFIQSVSLEKGDFVPVLDFEIHGKNKSVRKNLTKNAKIWLEIIEKHYGVKPIIYTNGYIYNTYIKENFENYPLWISDYDSQKLSHFGEDANILIWQHSTNGHLDGIKGNVDFNVFIGSKYHFDDICIK